MTDNSAKYAELSIVVPAFNEAGAIAHVLEQLTASMPGSEIIVVDDCSKDDTASTARRFQSVRVLRHAYNRGQGAALKTGMRHATRRYVAWFDADNEHRVHDLQTISEMIAAHNVVAVIGQRTTASTSLTRGIGKWILRLVGRGFQIKAGSDFNCGLRIFRRAIILRYLPLIPDRFSSSLVTTLVMLERGHPVAFLPVTTNPRIGHSTVRLKDGIEAALQLIRAVLMFAPMRFFLPIGLAGVGLGATYSLAIALALGQGVPVAGVLAIIVGTLVFVLGLIADQISQIRLTGLDNITLLETDPDGERNAITDSQAAPQLDTELQTYSHNARPAQSSDARSIDST